MIDAATARQPTSLSIGEAVELAGALSALVARTCDIRALIVKGSTLEAQGLRPPWTSSDVDLLVHPDDHADLVAALGEHGWRPRPQSTSVALLSTHSSTLLHPDWPCDIDVHHRYPGFLTEPGTAFETLWARHVTLDFGHVSCAVPDRLSSLLIHALHRMRTPGGLDPAARSELVARAALDATACVDLAALAAALGCVTSAGELLHAMGISAEASAAEARSPFQREWRGYVASTEVGTVRWLQAAAAAHGDAVRILWSAVWPSRADLRLDHPHLPPTRRAEVLERVRRWMRAARGLPRSVWRYWRSRPSPSRREPI